MENQMFCFQCQETYKGVGCTSKGICGKDSNLASLMDLLIYVTKGICAIKSSLSANGIGNTEGNYFITSSLFKTITNANFDIDDIRLQIAKGLELKEKLIAISKENDIVLPNIDAINWNGGVKDYEKKAKHVSILQESDQDIRSLKELIIYGIKGIAAYLHHAENLGFTDIKIHRFIHSALSETLNPTLSKTELMDLVKETGIIGLEAMKLLDKANTSAYGNPEMTRVNIGVRRNPGILISGHDLKDLEELLIQTQDTGVDVYTHCEMLPANAYPYFKKFAHFAGNYGNSWWEQREEFTAFKGPILFTTNCIVPPMENAIYRNRIYTTGTAALKGCTHIPDRKDGKPKDFSKIIEHALHCAPPKEIEYGNIIIGFGINQLSHLTDRIIDALENGTITRFVVMAGCDGRMKSREYYSDFAQLLPHDTLIITAGCAKYRYNKLNLRSIEGIPRVIDSGQCNDCYSIIQFAHFLKKRFEYKSLNDLPITYNIAWYEQKSVIILLALLSLGIRNIHIGPTLPAFLSPNILNLLQKNYNIGSISKPKDDIENWITEKMEMVL